MKHVMKFLALIFGMLMLANTANAESPREQFRQMVEQLQKSPSDDVLREKIIKFVKKLKPALAVPMEAEQFEGRAQFAFKNAKSPVDYLDAAKEYEKAIAVAPWVAGYYADLCTIYEKAEKYAEAKKSCEFFLASSPSVQDASDVRKRIAGLEFAIEKANSPEARATQEKVRQDAFLKSLDGARFVTIWESKGQFKFAEIEEVYGNTLISKRRILWAAPANLSGFEYDGLRPSHIGEEIEVDCGSGWKYKSDEPRRSQWKNGQFVCGNGTRIISISPDGQSLTWVGTSLVYQRE